MSLTAEIKKILEPPLLIITVGNTLRSDDGVGPYLKSKIQMTCPSGRRAKSKENSKPKIQIVNAGDQPESIMDKAVELKPKKIVIIDAADFGGKPGEIRLIDKEHIPETTLSTHTFPLKVIAKILEDDCKAPVYFLGIQPKSVALGEGLSLEVKQAAEEIVEYINAKN